MSAQQVVVSKGIYHGLPTFPDDKGLTAIITGANGISGNYMLRVLAQSPKRWTKIYCLSRRPPLIEGGLPANAEHIALDFLKTPEEIAATLTEKKITADHIFFFSYIQVPPKPGQGLWSDSEEMCRVNSLLLDNFIGGLKIAQVKPKRFMLQTGAKNYGIHLGPTILPHEEWNPRVELDPNFYYHQEDSLFKYSKEEGVGWNICMPGPILGAVPDAAMNLAFPLAVYAAVCQKLKQPLAFPGDISSWQSHMSNSSSMLNAYLEEWTVLTPKAKNQKFNAADNSFFAWESTWPKVAGWYGIEWTGPDLNAEYREIELPFVPRGYGPKSKVRTNFSMVQWASKKEVIETWKELVEEYSLRESWLKDTERVFGFLDGNLNRHSAMNISMDKSRKLGWHGFVDSSESLLEVFEDLARIKMIPPVPKNKVWFN